MTALVIGPSNRFTDRYASTGESETSLRLRDQLNKALSELRQAVTWNPLNSLYPELNGIVSESNTTGQLNDEYTYTITPETYSEAVKFIESLPMGINLPELIPEPDGDIGFEWSNGTYKVFVASVNGTGLITYAGLFGKNAKTHGVELFEENIPDNIIKNIWRIYR